MTSEQLANLSNYILYAAMTMVAIAMICYAVYLGVRQASMRAAGLGAPNQRALVGALTQSPAAAGAFEPERSAAGDNVDGGVDDAAVGRASSSRAGGQARWGGLATASAWLGTMLLAASMAMRGLSVSRAPVSNMFEFAVAAAFLVMLVYLLAGLKRPLKWAGVFVTTPVLLILGLAITVWYTEAGELVPSLRSTWLVIHVPVAILATALFTIAFVMLVLHLAQARREGQRAAAGQLGRASGDNDAAAQVRKSALDTLPDAASLDRTSYALHIAAFPLWTFTLIAGAIWGQQAWGTYWSWDPKEVWTFVIWVIYAAYLHARATSGWSLRRSNIIAVIGYLAIIVNFTIVNMYFPGMHSYSGL